MEFIEKISKLFYKAIIILLFVLLFYSTLELIVLVFRTMINNTLVYDFNQTTVDTEKLFIQYVQGFIAAVLLLTIILELIHSFMLVIKSEDHSKYLVVLYEIAMIAIVRHLFALDFEHIDGVKLLGISGIVLVLGVLIFMSKTSTAAKIFKSKVS